MRTDTHMDAEYTEVWPRALYYPTPHEYDRWGYNDRGEQWEHRDLVFALMDDFGCAVPFDTFAYATEDMRAYLAPDFDPENIPKDVCPEKYPYILHTPVPH